MFSITSCIQIKATKIESWKIYQISLVTSISFNKENITRVRRVLTRDSFQWKESLFYVSNLREVLLRTLPSALTSAIADAVARHFKFYRRLPLTSFRVILYLRLLRDFIIWIYDYRGYLKINWCSRMYLVVCKLLNFYVEFVWNFPAQIYYQTPREIVINFNSTYDCFIVY